MVAKHVGKNIMTWFNKEETNCNMNHRNRINLGPKSKDLLLSRIANIAIGTTIISNYSYDCQFQRNRDNIIDFYCRRHRPCTHHRIKRRRDDLGEREVAKSLSFHHSSRFFQLLGLSILQGRLTALPHKKKTQRKSMREE